MAKKKERIREISVIESKGNFKIVKRSKKNDFSNLSELKQVLNDEKARLLHTIKTSNPSSIYDLAKKLGRNFKNVNDDVKLLEKLGIIGLFEEKTGKRIGYSPKIILDVFSINVRV